MRLALCSLLLLAAAAGSAGAQTYCDKVVLPDLRNNATLAAMLAYMASEDPERVSRDAATREDQRPECPPVIREYRAR